MPVFRGKKLGGRAWLVTPGAVQPPPPPDVPPPPTGGGPVQGNTTATLGSSTSFDKNRVFNRDVYTGNPAGFTTGFGKGWGAVPATVTPSADIITGMWVELRDARDPAAVATTVGTGAVIQPPVALPGIVNLTKNIPNTVNMIIPAGLAWYYADLALNSAMTNAVRIPIPFGVGAVFLEGPNTSHGGMMLGPFAYAAAQCGMIEDIVAISPYGVGFSPTPAGAATLTGTDATTWQRPGNFGNSPYTTTFAAEFLRLSVAKLGVNCALIGQGQTGGRSTDYVLKSVGPYATILSLLARAGNKCEAMLGLLGANDAVEYATRTQTWKNLKAVYDGVQAVNTVSNMGAVVASSPLVDFNNGSGTVRQQQLSQRDLELSLPRAANNEWFDIGYGNVTNHTTMLERVRIARGYYRLAMGLMGTAKGGFALRRGPRIISGTRSGTTITLTVQHDGGAALVVKAWSDGSPFTATASVDATPDNDSLALAWLFSVYPAGHEYPFAAGDPSIVPFASTTKVQVVDATTINLFLATDPGPSVALDVYYGMDMGGATPASSTLAQYLFDDTTDGDGLPYGRPMARTLSPVYIPPPTPTVQDLTFGTMPASVPGGWLFVNGNGTGLSLSDGDTAAIAGTSTKIEVSVNGGTYAVPTGLRVLTNNDWSGLAKIPSTIAAGTSISVTVRRVGQTTADATTTVAVVSARNELPNPDGTGALRTAAVVSYDALNAGTMWQDAAKTIPAAHGQPVRVWQDALGTPSNDISHQQPGGFPPWLDLHKRAMGNRSVTAERPYVQFGQNVGTDHVTGSRLQAVGAAFAGQLSDDFTLFVVADGILAAPWFTITVPTGSWSWGPEITSTGKILKRRSGGTSTSGAILTTLSAPSPNTWALDYMILRYDSSTGILKGQNRAAAVVTATDAAKPSFPTLNTFFLGGGFEGPNATGPIRIHQFTAFNRALTDAEVTALNTYAAVKWPW